MNITANCLLWVCLVVFCLCMYMTVGEGGGRVVLRNVQSRTHTVLFFFTCLLMDARVAA